MKIAVTDMVKCPECSKQVKRKGLGTHRRIAHGIVKGHDDKAKTKKKSKAVPIKKTSTPRCVAGEVDLKKVAEEFILLRMDDPLTGSNELFQKAQKITNGKRTIGRLGTQAQEAIMGEWNSFLTMPDVLDDIEETPVKEQVAPEPESVQFDLEKKLNEMPLEDLMAVVGRRLGGFIKLFLPPQEIVEKKAEPAQPPPREPRAPVLPKIKKTKVGVTGMREDQFKAMAGTYYGPFELVYIDGGRSKITVPTGVVAVVAAKFINHSRSYQIMKAVGKKNYYQLHGSSVVKKLRSLGNILGVAV